MWTKTDIVYAILVTPYFKDLFSLLTSMHVTSNIGIYIMIIFIKHILMPDSA